MLIGVIIYGVKKGDNSNVDLGWSYILTIIGMIATFAAGIVSALQLKSSGVQI